MLYRILSISALTILLSTSLGFAVQLDSADGAGAQKAAAVAKPAAVATPSALGMKSVATCPETGTNVETTQQDRATAAVELSDAALKARKDAEEKAIKAAEDAKAGVHK